MLKFVGRKQVMYKCYRKQKNYLNFIIPPAFFFIRGEGFSKSTVQNLRRPKLNIKITNGMQRVVENWALSLA